MQFDLVFEGGGAKGTVFVGALQELEAQGHTPARLLGTSAGSIMSTLLAAGYTAGEMEAALSEKEGDQPVFMGFLETPPVPSPDVIQNSAFRDLLREVNIAILPDIVEEVLDDQIAKAIATSRLTGRIFSFVEDGGFYAAQTFLTWFENKLNSGTYSLDRGAHKKGTTRNFGGMTMAEFYEATGADLSLVASDTTASQILILNHRTTPELPVIWGVRMSMSVPLLWHEVVWQTEWGSYRGRDLTGHAVVDGGLLSNFPIELFLSSQPQVLAVMGEKTTEDENVLGFLIDESISVPGAPEPLSEEKTFDFGKLRSVQRIQNLINTLTQAHDKMVIDAFEHLVVRLPAKGFGTIEFGMTDERRSALIAAGRAATVGHFKRAEGPKPERMSFGMKSLEVEEQVSPADKIATRLLEM